MTGLLAWAWLFTLPGLVLTGLGLPAGPRRAGWASLPGPALLLLVALLSLLSGGTARIDVPGWLPFLPDGAFRILADPLSALMLTVLGVVATLVYVYSLGYMAEDPGKRRFFVYLDVFVAAMAVLVLAGNLAVLLIGWTGVGITSFLLISFWRDRPYTLGAGLQALAANAIGDGALLLAAVLLPAGCGQLTTLGSAQCSAGVGGIGLLAILLYVAAAAKSAQGPLYFWLPSAMAGPTPISALIHAATMVAAGVYLLVRTHALMAQAPQVEAWIAGIGVATAVAASLMSFIQPNFKRGVAYSTVAQLGYMFSAIGVGAPFAALFHLFTHAFFKALLFLSAGVVIHGENGEESLARLSGRGRAYRFSQAGFLLGSLALIGVPLFSGAFSKDAIIEAAIERTPLVGYLLLASVVLTGLYVGRLYARVYHGAPSPDLRGQTRQHVEHDAGHARLMDWALVPLMVLSVVAGFLGLGWLQGVLQGSVGDAPTVAPISALSLTAAALGLVGFAFSWATQRGRISAAVESTPGAAPWVRLIADIGGGVAELVAAVQAGPLPRYAFGSIVAVALILLLRVAAR